MISEKNVAIIVAAGSIEKEEAFYAPFLQQKAFKIAVDGGIRIFRNQSILPDLFLGDMDSICKEDVDWACKNSIPQKKFSCDKDKTDTHLALDMAIEQHYHPVYLLGGIGSRLDHTLGNLYLLIYGHQRGVDVQMFHPLHRVLLLSNSYHRTIQKQHGSTVSVLPVTQSISGLTMKGFRWNLEKATIAQGLTWTISNSLQEAEGLISLEEGIAFIIQEKEE